MKYLKPRLPKKEIELCLDLFDKEEAKDRILLYVKGLIDDAEYQFNLLNIHGVGCSCQKRVNGLSGKTGAP